MTIQLTAALLVFVVGLVGVITAAIKGEYQSSAPWFNTAFLVTALALLGGIAIR